MIKLMHHKVFEKQHIRSLDGLRGYAALAVCVYHGADIFGKKNLIPHAYLAVDLFFVLSGFVLFYRYHQEMLSEANPLGLWDYISQRMARLYPLYLFATIVGIGFYWFMFVYHGNFRVNFRRLWDMADNAIFLIPYLEPNITNPTKKIFPYTHQAWSIFWELVLSFGFYFTLRWGKVLEFAIALAAIMGVVISTYALQDIDEGWRNKHFEIGFFRSFASFYIGVLIGRIYDWTRRKKPRFFPNTMSVLSTLLFLLIIFYFQFVKKTHWEFDLIFLYVLFPLLIISSAFSSFSILNWRIFQFLGKISYSVYLLHGTATLIPLWIMLNLKWFKGSITNGMIWLSLVIILSYVTYRFIEMPMRTKVRNVLTGIGNAIASFISKRTGSER